MSYFYGLHLLIHRFNRKIKIKLIYNLLINKYYGKLIKFSLYQARNLQKKYVCGIVLVQ